MAEPDEDVQYLRESRLHYGDSKPPFVRDTFPSSRNTSTIRLTDTGEHQVVHYRTYPSALGHFFYGTILIGGLTYIICALPKGWSEGDATYHTGGCRDWFVWQGPDHKFRGPLFDGPVARAAGKVGKTAKRQATSAAEAPSSQPPSSRTRRAHIRSMRDSSPPFFEGSPRPNERVDLTALHPDSVGLTPDQEHDTKLHIKTHQHRETYFELRLSRARPQSDPNSAVTIESLFEKVISRARPSPGEIYALEATFLPDPLDMTEGSVEVRENWPNLDPLRIIRGEKDTFECFLSHVLAFNESDVKISWYVDLRVIAE